MSEQDKFEIIGEVPQSKHGSYQRQDEHGRVVHGDASGEWTLDESGDLDDIVFFVSPGAMRRWTADPPYDARAPAQERPAPIHCATRRSEDKSVRFDAGKLLDTVLEPR